MAVLRTYEIAVITALAGRLPIESKYCASGAWLVALSSAGGVLQQFT
ncbi:hypothetical protein [Candidatus Binatus sp.]